jgi:hypothetical protein
MSALTVPVAVFRLGRITTTPNALESIAQEDIFKGIQRHQAGDWGNLTADQRAANDRALVKGTRILSSYSAVNGTKFLIFTEGDRLASPFSGKPFLVTKRASFRWKSIVALDSAPETQRQIIIGPPRTDRFGSIIMLT